jgi:hypothetical protein
MHEKQLAASTRHACLSLSLSCFAKKKAYRPLRRCKVVFRCFIYARCQSMHGRRQASYQCKQLVALSSPKLSFPAVFDSLLIFSCCAPPHLARILTMTKVQAHGYKSTQSALALAHGQNESIEQAKRKKKYDMD